MSGPPQADETHLPSDEAYRGAAQTDAVYLSSDGA